MRGKLPHDGHQCVHATVPVLPSCLRMTQEAPFLNHVAQYLVSAQYMVSGISDSSSESGVYPWRYGYTNSRLRLHTFHVLL